MVEAVKERFPPPEGRHTIDSGPWFQVQAQSPRSVALDGRSWGYCAGWACGVAYEGEDFMVGLNAAGDTMPLAVCRAALLAVSQE